MTDPALRLVLFDCDGTLVDSQHAIVHAMETAFTRVGLALPPSSFVIPIRWRGSTALLVIGLEASGVS